MTLPCLSGAARALSIAAFLTAGSAVRPTSLQAAPNAEPAPALAHMRVWKTELHDFPILRVTVTSTGGHAKAHSTAQELGNIGPGYIFDGYVEVPAGHGTLETYDTPPAAGKTPAGRPLLSLPIDLAPGAFATVLLEEPLAAKGPPRIQFIVDSIDDPSTAQLTVRGLGTAAKDVRVTLGDALNAQFAGSGSYLQMRGLRLAPYTVRTAGAHPDGKPFDWSTAVDFKQHPHQTLLIYPDPYGHIHPRLSVDGEAPPTVPNGEREH